MKNKLHLTKLTKLIQKSNAKKIEIELILLRLNVNISAEYFYSSAKKRFPMLLLRLRLLKLEESVFLTPFYGNTSYYNRYFVALKKIKNTK
jgi:hypothetical protein